MIIKLKRDLFLGGTLFKASRFGTEIPDMIEGKPVVTATATKPKGEHWVLPKDAVRLDELKEEKKVPDQPLALSQMNTTMAKPKSFVEAMKSDED